MSRCFACYPPRKPGRGKLTSSPFIVNLIDPHSRFPSRTERPRMFISRCVVYQLSPPPMGRLHGDTRRCRTDHLLMDLDINSLLTPTSANCSSLQHAPASVRLQKV